AVHLRARIHPMQRLRAPAHSERGIACRSRECRHLHTRNFVRFGDGIRSTILLVAAEDARADVKNDQSKNDNGPTITGVHAAPEVGLRPAPPCYGIVPDLSQHDASRLTPPPAVSGPRCPRGAFAE